MFNLSNSTEKHFCFECKEMCPHTVEYSNNKSKSKNICSLCKHISHWNISVYPNPPKGKTNKQVDYVLKDIAKKIEGG